MSNATSQSSFETDDRGVYRVYGLMPGRYLVSVGEGEGGIRYGNAGATYPRTFHPGVIEEAQAQAVEVTAGGEATGVDIALADAAKTFTASGRVVDADTGQPLANSSVSYNTFISGDLRGGGYGGSTDAKGEFRIKHLLPGSYAASVRPDYADGGAATDDNFYSDVAPFEIVDADATGLEIKVHRGASISGVFVLDNTQARAVLAKLPQLGLYARQLKSKPDQRSMAFGSLSRVNADGTFHLAGLRPGKVQLALNNSSPHPRGFTLTRVERNGVEVGSDGFDLAAGEQLTGVRVHLAYGNGTLRGQVETREGAAAAALPANVRLGVRVYRAGEADSHVQPVGFAEVDARGRFVIEGLLGGNYDVVVFGYFTAPPVGRLPDARQSVNVADNGETNVTISYDLSAGRDKEQQP